MAMTSFEELEMEISCCVVADLAPYLDKLRATMVEHPFTVVNYSFFERNITSAYYWGFAAGREKRND